VRVFVAVDIDSASARKISDFCDDLRRKAMSLAPRARIAWVRPEQLHVTVRFIGEVDAPRAAAIAAALQPESAVQRFEMIIRGVGAFPPQGAPRVFWTNIARGADSLSALEREVSERVATCGVGHEGRPFRPHLTVARVRDASGLRSAPLLEGLADCGFGATQVDAITLFESRTAPTGAIYVSLQRTPLRFAE
jgi:RNA 2',3'-cyclic 3'-phosphodiesterase